MKHSGGTCHRRQPLVLLFPIPTCGEFLCAPRLVPRHPHICVEQSYGRDPFAVCSGDGDGDEESRPGHHWLEGRCKRDPGLCSIQQSTRRCGPDTGRKGSSTPREASCLPQCDPRTDLVDAFRFRIRLKRRYLSCILYSTCIYLITLPYKPLLGLSIDRSSSCPCRETARCQNRRESSSYVRRKIDEIQKCWGGIMESARKIKRVTKDWRMQSTESWNNKSGGIGQCRIGTIRGRTWLAGSTYVRKEYVRQVREDQKTHIIPMQCFREQIEHQR